MNEHGYIRSVHRHLPADLHKWKVHDNYAGGVPDCWYAGPTGNIWVEYKWIKALPKRDSTLIKPNLSAQQLAWLIKMSGHGISCACIIGTPDGGIILQKEKDWQNGISKSTIDNPMKLGALNDLSALLLPNKVVAEWLTTRCMEAVNYEHKEENNIR